MSSGLKKFGLAFFGLGGATGLITGVVGLSHNLVKHENIISNAKLVATSVKGLSGSSDRRKEVASSVKNLFESASRDLGLSKWKTLTEKKSGPIGYWKGGYDSEVYLISPYAYIGNRRFNKPRNINLKIDARNGMGFEVGDFKDDSVKEGSYVGYDSDNFMLMLGSVYKYELDGWCLVFDELNQEIKFIDYDRGDPEGYINFPDDSDIPTYNDFEDNKVLAEYDFDDKTFKKVKKGDIPDDDMKIENNDGVIYFKDNDKNKWEWNVYDNTFTFKGETIDFSGNAYQCSIKGYYKGKDNWISYDWNTMSHCKIAQSDGSYGEFKFASNEETATFFDNFSSMMSDACKFGASYAVDEVINTAIDCVPYLGALDTISGGQISDCAREMLDGVVEESTGTRLDDLIDGVTGFNKDDKDDENSSVKDETELDEKDVNEKEESQEEMEERLKKELEDQNKSETDKLKDKVFNFFN